MNCTFIARDNALPSTISFNIITYYGLLLSILLLTPVLIRHPQSMLQRDSHLSAARTHSAHGYAALSIRKTHPACQAKTICIGYGARFVVRRCCGLRLRLASGCGRPLELVDATAHTYNCWGLWSTESVRAMRTATETDANVRTPNPTLHPRRQSPAAKRQQGQLCRQKL